MTYDHKDSCMEWVEAHKWEDEDGKWWTAHEEHRTVPLEYRTGLQPKNVIRTYLVPDEGPFETEEAVDEILWPRAVEQRHIAFYGE